MQTYLSIVFSSSCYRSIPYSYIQEKPIAATGSSRCTPAPLTHLTRKIVLRSHLYPTDGVLPVRYPLDEISTPDNNRRTSEQDLTYLLNLCAVACYWLVIFLVKPLNKDTWQADAN